ncbi:unnamed protein product [Chilo suppressalis]|uniref:Uncharacterized protein n=1 Tax=Chilo suppressalis TaxID=168631 RepID=A0ABN8L8L3_CHISP|nr:unnamed protein product [Chilo suppressalis]
MPRYVALLLIMMICESVRAPPPMRVTIDCSADKRDTPAVSYGPNLRAKNVHSDLDMRSFCSLINSAIPKAVEDGRFILLEDRDDQEGFGDTLFPISVAPPAGFIPKLPNLRPPRLRIPKLKVPTLSFHEKTLLTPKLGSFRSPKVFAARASPDEETSAERMEKFKKGVQKLLHVVKVLSKVDQYLSERTRIIVDKLSKTFD